jgi:peroxin-14
MPQASLITPAGAVVSVGSSLRSRLHWYHAIIAVGVLAVSGAGTVVLFKKTVIPRLKSWIRKVAMDEDNNDVKEIDSKPSLAEEAAAAAKSAAAAAADVAMASQAMLNSKNDEKRYFQELMTLLDVQVREMKSMGSAIQRLEGADKGPASSSKQPYANGKMELDSYSVGSSSPSATVEPSAAPHPKSYMEIMEMVQRGEKPPNVRDIDDMPPNPNQQPSNPRLVPRTKPWEAAQAQNGSSQVLQSQVNEEGFNSPIQDNVLRSYKADVDNSVPWYRKSAQPKSAPYNVQRTWVPPQPPPVAMAEAAEAIRRPKSAAKKEQVAEGIDELQRITAISESGGALKTNGSSSAVEINEIVEEQVIE